MKSLDSKFLKKFLATAVNELEGDWVLLGGTLLPALGLDYRMTTDIDLVSLDSKNSNAAMLQLMALAEKHGLPVESVNQSAAFFLEKVPGYRKSLVLLHEGKKGRIYRPNATLYLLLKIKRMTASDLADCLNFMKWVKRKKELLDTKKVLENIEIENAKASGCVEKSQHLAQLRDALQYYSKKI